MTDTGKKIVAAIRGHAAARPGYVYDGDSCVYVSEGEPSCLVGQALWNLNLIGPELEAARSLIPQRTSSTHIHPNHAVAHDLLVHLGVELDPIDEVWIDKVQDAQDDSYSWGSAIKQADESVLIPA